MADREVRAGCAYVVVIEFGVAGMRQRQIKQRGAVASGAAGGRDATWIMATILVAGVIVCGAGLARGQTAVPEVVKPRTDSPTLPPTGVEGPVSRPRSENPLADSGPARPIPDSGVIAPPSPGSTPVIRPPSVGTMPVIPPPGSPGGDRTVVPK